MLSGDENRHSQTFEIMPGSAFFGRGLRYHWYDMLFVSAHQRSIEAVAVEASTDDIRLARLNIDRGVTASKSNLKLRFCVWPRRGYRP